jgi:hypothetical protein
MAKKLKVRLFEDAVAWFKDHSFDVLEAPGASHRVFLKKYHCSAAIERTDNSGVKIFAYPGYLINGEISKLVDHGYQKVLQTTKAEYPATADHLKALHDFSEELKEGLGMIRKAQTSLAAISCHQEASRLAGGSQDVFPACQVVSARIQREYK